MNTKTLEAETSLEKTYKPSWIFAMAVGSAIGWGAFILPFDWMSTGGLAGTLIGFCLAGILIGVIALSYGDAIRALPVTGGPVAYAQSAFGKTHAFIAGWSLTLGYSGIVALNASAVTLVFRVTVPGVVKKVKLYEIAGWEIYLPEVLIASAFIIIFCWINIAGTQISGTFQLVAVLILLVCVFIITAFMFGYYIVHQPPMSTMFPPEKDPLFAILAIVAFAPWAYVGFDSVPQLAGEFNFSPRKATELLIWGILSATLIYMGMMISTSIAVGIDHHVYASDAWPPAIAIESVMGPAGLILMVLAVLSGVLTGLNGFFTASSRVLYTLGKAELIPSSFGTLHPKHKTPVQSLLFVAFICLITPWFGRAALSWIVDMTSVGIALAYAYTCLFTFEMHRKGILPGMKQQIEKSTSKKATALAGILTSFGFLLLLLIPNAPGSLSKESLVALAIWVLLGALFYIGRSNIISKLSNKSINQVILE